MDIAFASSTALPVLRRLHSTRALPNITSRRPRSVPRCMAMPTKSAQPPDPPAGDDDDDDFASFDPSLFAPEEQESRDPFWKRVDVSETFSPLRPEEEEALREKIPAPVANFLIRRANDAVRLRSPPAPEDDSFTARLMRDLPPDTPDPNAEENLPFRDYVYTTSSGAPSFRRRGSSLFGGGDGLPDPGEDGLVGEPLDPDDPEAVDDIDPNDRWAGAPHREKRVLSLFVGQYDSVDEQAARLGYGVLSLFALWIILKLVFAVVSFFLSFTFSFLAIFALSAGIFVTFFLLRW